MVGLVEVLGHPGQRVEGDLHIQIIVPGEGLAVPPPAEEGAVGKPGFHAIVAHDGEIGFDEIAQD